MIAKLFHLITENSMKKSFLALTLFSLSSLVHAHTHTEQVKIAYQKAMGFGNAVYCEVTPLVGKSPDKNVFLMEEDKEDGIVSYVVIYYGDCDGGSGTNFAKLTPVYFGPSALMKNGYISITEPKEYDLFTLNSEINPRFIEKVTQKEIGTISIVSSEYAENDGNAMPSKKFEYEVKLPEMKILKKTQIN